MGQLVFNFPATWRRARVGQLVSIVYGKALKEDDRDGTGDVKVFGSGGQVGKHTESLHPGPSIVIGRKGSVGATYFVDSPFWAIDTAFYVSDPSALVELEYLWAAFRFFRLERFVITSGVPGINRGDIEQFEIPLPPLSEQRRIVEILNEARDIQRLRQQADDLTTKLIPAIFHDMFGDRISDATTSELVVLRDACVNQDDIRCGPFGTQLRQEEFVEQGVPLWGIKHVNSKFAFQTNEFVTAEKAKELDRYSLLSNDIVMTRKGTIGNCAIYPEHFPLGIMHSDLLRLRVDTAKCNPVFLCEQLHNSPRIVRQIGQDSTGAVMPGINVGRLKKIRVFLPDISEQNEFTNRVTQAYSAWSQQGDSQVLFEAAVSSLLAHAFSGELTADWRDANRELLAQEATERDQWLRESGVKLIVADTKIAAYTEDADDRHAELNREQHELLSQIQSLELDDSAGTFTLSTLTDSLLEPLDKLPVATVRRHLDVLAARGLVKSLSRRAGAGGSIDVAFGNAYRLPKDDKQAAKTDSEPDEVRMSELDRMLQQGRAFHASITEKLNMSVTATATVARLSAGNLAPITGMYQEIDRDGKLGKTFFLEKGRSLPPPSLDGGTYLHTGDE